MLLLCLHGVGGRCNVAFGDRIGKDALFLLRVVDTRGGADMQSPVCLHIHESITEKTPIVVAVVRVAVQSRHGILAVRIATHRTGIPAVLGIDRQRWIELQRVLQDAAGRLYLGGAAQGEVLADGNTVVEKRIVGVGTRGESVEVRVADYTQVLVVVHREETASVLAALADGQVVLLHHTGARNLVEPVGIRCGRSAGGIQIFLHRYAVEHRIAVRIVVPPVTITQTIGVRVETVVHIRLPQTLPELFSIEHRHAVHVSARRDTGVESYFHLAFPAFLGRDDNHAIGCTGAVNTRRSGIFQHLDGLDVVAVEFVHAALGRHAVDDIKRVVVVERADTTDTHRGAARW